MEQTASGQRIFWLVGDRFLIAPEIDKAAGQRERLRIDGAHLDVSSLVGEVSTSDLFSTERAVVVDDFWPRAKELSPQARKRLVHLLDHLPPGVVLIFATYLERGRARPGGTNDIEKALTPYKTEKRAPPQWRERELTSWVTSHAHSKGRRISAEAAAAIVDRVGADLGILAQEIDKVILSMDEARDQITFDDLDVVSRGTAGFSKLLRAVSARDAAAALPALDDLLRSAEQPAAILGALSASARMTARARLAIERGAARDQLAQELGIAPGRAYYVMNDARRLTKAEVESWLELLLRCDVAMKRGGDAKQLLALLILGLCSRLSPAQFEGAVSAYTMLG